MNVLKYLLLSGFFLKVFYPPSLPQDGMGTDSIIYNCPDSVSIYTITGEKIDMIPPVDKGIYIISTNGNASVISIHKKP